MASKRDAGGHAFNFDTHVCAKCGMAREDFRDKGLPACSGRKPEKREPFRVPADNVE